MKLDWLHIYILLCASLTLDSAIILSTRNLLQSSATYFVEIHLQHSPGTKPVLLLGSLSKQTHRVFCNIGKLGMLENDSF